MRERGSYAELADALAESGIRVQLMRRALDRAEAAGPSPEVAGLTELLYAMWRAQNALVASMGAPYRNTNGGNR